MLVSAAAIALSAVAFHCGSEELSAELPTGPGADGGDEGTGPIDFGGTCDGAPCPLGDSGIRPVTCGDGLLDDKLSERCDDGNAKSGDGCSATCDLEPGWLCPTPGLRCQAAKCGDGIIAGVEECDFKPGQPVTGCSATTCRIEAGFDCNATTLACSAVVCGDGKVQRGETCEDGNALPFDGCFECRKEPVCTNGVCQASCGDGQRFAGEACDDGNTRAGDGCSPTCTVETGYACADVLGAPPTSIDQPVLIRDFIGVGREAGGSTGHDDFNGLGGTGILGIVEAQLTAAGKPALNCPGGNCAMNPGVLGGSGRHANITTATNFAQWYVNVAGTNIASSITVPLARQPDGTYTWDSADPTVNGGKSYFDPMNTGGWVALGKETLAPCGAASAPDRNVSFTSETHFWFEYQGGERFDFAGDDDTWVFVNRKLAIDLGGLHTPRTGFFVLDAANGTATFSSDMPQSGTVNLGLVKGGTYEVVMFQAERNECGSNFRVTLKDFNRPKSTCASKCGDGIVASDEVCDDGKNVGGYGSCMPGCKARGPFCGDGHIDPTEQCDEGTQNANPLGSCTANCQRQAIE
ncbi:MAG: Multiple EGF-like-domain protein 3 precursor [Labilithrix sp.]|nr:Multiple EGF-like-domain protein 3 precursor [Labilithrix sp.]